MKRKGETRELNKHQEEEANESKTMTKSKHAKYINIVPMRYIKTYMLTGDRDRCMHL